jgi:hypothetical protein
MIRTRAIYSLLFLAIFLPGLSACDCGPAGPACAYVGRAAVVFIGTVEFTDHDPSQGLRQSTHVRFKVEEAFKGVPADVRAIWIDPGSFTSCYAEYQIGERLLVFAYGGRTMPPDASMMSVVPGQSEPKPVPPEMNQRTLVYSAPECSGTRLADARDHGVGLDIEYLRQFRAGTATPSVRGRVTEDSGFGIFDRDPLPGLSGAAVSLTGSGIARSTVTDQDGYYVFSNTPAGTYMVTPTLRFYVAPRGTREVEVATPGCGAADFDMTGSASVTGTLLDSAARPARNVRVEILRLNRYGKPIFYAEKNVVANNEGQYRFTELPKGEFQIGVNLFNAPDPKTPYKPTRWSADDSSSIHLSPGEHGRVSPFRLPPRLAVRKVVAEVRWSDGRPASGVTVWGDVGDRAAAGGETNAKGIAHFQVLEGLQYKVEATIWVGPRGHREVARSGAMDVTPEKAPIRLKLVLSKRSQYF